MLASDLGLGQDAIYTISAWVVQNGVVLSQLRVEKTIRKLLTTM